MENGKDFVPPTLSKEPAHKSLKIGDGYCIMGFEAVDTLAMGQIVTRHFPGEDKGRRFRVIDVTECAVEAEYLGFDYAP